MTVSPKRPLWVRVLRGIAYALVAFELVYVIAANTILQTRSLDHWLTGATKGLVVKIESGWTVWPGRVHIENFELHFEDYNVQFLLSLDSADVVLSLWELPTKTFHLKRVRAEGARYLFRHRVHDTKGIEQRLALYPKIPGYADPPLYEGPPTPPLTDEQYNLWTIHLEDVDAGIKELWFLEYRFTGKGRAGGGFRMLPERDAQTERCTLKLDGKLQAGPTTVFTKLSGRIGAQLDRHDPRIVQGAKIFGKISVDVDLHGDIPNLDVSRLYASAGDLVLRGGKGPLRLRAKAKHGAWQAETALSYTTERIAISQGHQGAAGALRLETRMLKTGKDSVVELTASTPRFTMFADGAPKDVPAPRATKLSVSLASTADLTEPIRLTALDAQTHLSVPHLLWLNHALDKKDLFLSGRASAQASMHWSEAEPTMSELALDATDAVFRLSGRAVRVSAKLDTRLRYDPKPKRGYAERVTLDLTQVAVADDERWKTLPSGVHIDTQQLSWSDFPPHTFHARAEIQTDSIKPLVPIVIPSDILRALALVNFDIGKTRATVDVDRTANALAVRVSKAHSGSVEFSGLLKKEKRESGDPCGWFFLDGSIINVGVVIEAGSTSVKPMVSSTWWKEQPTDDKLVCKRAPS